MFCFLYVTSHFQNILGPLGLASQLYFALVSSLNSDNLYTLLALAGMTLGFFWKHPSHSHLLASVMWHLSH